MSSNYGQKPPLRVDTAPPASEKTPNAKLIATPPTTPIASSSGTECGSVSPRFDAKITSHVAAARRRALFETPPSPFGTCTEDIERGTRVRLGCGAWAEVVRGTLSSPFGKAIVAIKQPCYPGADKILRQEAGVLSYITNTAPKDSIVRFLGFDAVHSTIVMEHVSGTTLAQFSRESRLRRADRGGTTASRSEPVIGLHEWLDIAKQLADTFVHLKGIGVVHGDVTWHNVLMKETPTGSGVRLNPVVIDFSSGHLEVDGYSPAAVSATTTAFCSPELLEAHIRRPSTPPLGSTDKPMEEDHGPISTFASDLYGLAMTLLSSAIGSEVYENAGRHGGIYARQGQPLEWVRNGDSFLIVGVRSVVSKTLSGCFGRIAEKRIGVEELRDRIVQHSEGSM
ncbi:kinase-like domain-containing protein [Sphaerosporella brunnea]|uniref:EKC/KEOPS complex subunit BUD32 n=1 Tax=Sphaerosporella brunnea TaxID=1250544 RepID=A0A5J5F994_9PEZI|nr:kinase-like domain-containing protein [Sphaerosporella brunnea]